jgi:hypothetical protein
MEQSEARDILRKLRTELTAAEEAVAAGQRRAAALAKLVDGYVELFPDLAHDDAQDTDEGEDERGVPRGQEAVRRVMESIEFRGRYWTVTAMVQALEQRGWLPRNTKGDPAAAVRTALDRLSVKEGSRVHKGRGRTGTVVFYYEGEGYPPPQFEGRLRTVGEILGHDHPLAAVARMTTREEAMP